MATAQSELSMDEILASIRRIIHEEDEPQQRPVADDTNTVDLREKKAAAAKAMAKPAGDKIASKAEKPVPQERAPEEKAPEVTLGDALMAQNMRQKPDAAPEADDAPFETLNTMRDILPSADSIAKEVEKAAPVEDTPATEAEVEKEPPMAELAPEPEIKTATVVDTPPAEEPPVVASDDGAASEAELTDQAVKSLMSAAQTDQVSTAFASLKKSVQVTSTGGQSLEGMVEAMLRPLLKEWLDANLPSIVEAKVEAEIKRIAAQ